MFIEVCLAGQSGGAKCWPSKVSVYIVVQPAPVQLVSVSVHAVSLPRLEGFDWRVDVKTSSDCAARMAVPTCLLEMKVSTCQACSSRGGVCVC